MDRGLKFLCNSLWPPCWKLHHGWSVVSLGLITSVLRPLGYSVTHQTRSSLRKGQVWSSVWAQCFTGSQGRHYPAGQTGSSMGLFLSSPTPCQGQGLIQTGRIGGSVSCIHAAAAAAAKSLQSCPTLCGPIDGSTPGSPVPGILQARTLEWVAIAFSPVYMG